MDFTDNIANSLAKSISSSRSVSHWLVLDTVFEAMKIGLR